MNLRIAENLALPLDVITDTIGILAIKGSGKTYAFLVLVEEMVKHNLPAVVIDTMGVCWGLRSSVDGKAPGLAVVILGGNHGDVPLEAGAGKVIADWIVEERQPVVLDISEFSKGEASRFVLDFTSRLFQTNREAIHLVIDEADEWAPQRPFREEARTLRALEVLVRRGRARGIGVTLVTQRPATLNKNVLTQVSTLIVGRMIAPQDRKAVQAWIDAHGTEKQKEEFWDSLASLSTKDKWIWSPGRNIFKKVTIRTRETFDSSATPKVGERIAAPKALAEVDLEALRGRISATIEKAKQEDPRELRRQLAEMTRLYQKVLGATTQKVEIPVEVPVLSDAQIEALNKAVAEMEKVSISILNPITDRIEKAGISISESLRKWLSTYSDRNISGANKTKMLIDTETLQYKRGAGKELRKMFKPVITPDHDIKLRLGERRMLEVLARWYPARLTKAQLATLSRLTVTSGTFAAYYGVLKRERLINEERNGVMLSEAGLSQSDVPRIGDPQTTEEVVSMWRSALRLGERKLLDVLIEIYPKSVTKEELAERTELTANAGTFSAYIGTLRRNGLAEVSGGRVSAGEALFLMDRR